MIKPILQEEITRNIFNRLKKYYDQSWDPKSQTLHIGMFQQPSDGLMDAYKNTNKYFFKCIQKRKPVGKTARVLDVGCGTGQTLIQLCARYGCSGIGVDLSDEQIKQAKRSLKAVNEKRVQGGRMALRITFLRLSASHLLDRLKPNQFTHVMSQDALLMVQDKVHLYESLYTLLAPGGLLAISDFLQEKSQKNLSSQKQKSIYEIINWRTGLSFLGYQRILNDVGFKRIKAEKHTKDMAKTYVLLASHMDSFVKKDPQDKTWSDLQIRYAHISEAAKKNLIGWGFFFAHK